MANVSINTLSGVEYVVLGTPLAADCALSATGNLTIGDSTTGAQKTIPYSSIISSTKQAKVAEVSQVDTVTPTAANSVTYTLVLAQTVENGFYYTQTYSYTSDSSATATEICNGFRSVINGDTKIKVTASGTTTLVLTADAGYSQFLTTVVTSSSSTGVLAIANTTAGVYAINTGALLITQGYTTAVSGTNYTSYTIQYKETDFGNVPGQFLKTFVVLASETDASKLADFNPNILSVGTATESGGFPATVKCNGLSGVITTEALTTAASVAVGVLTLQNNFLTATSNIVLTCGYGTATQGAPNAVVASKSAGSCTIRLANGKTGTEALDGTIILGFTVTL
jgi:hypothetical protein